MTKNKKHTKHKKGSTREKSKIKIRSNTKRKSGGRKTKKSKTTRSYEKREKSEKRVKRATRSLSRFRAKKSRLYGNVSVDLYKKEYQLPDKKGVKVDFENLYLVHSEIFEAFWNLVKKEYNNNKPSYRDLWLVKLKYEFNFKKQKIRRIQYFSIEVAEIENIQQMRRYFMALIEAFLAQFEYYFEKGFRDITVVGVLVQYYRRVKKRETKSKTTKKRRTKKR